MAEDFNIIVYMISILSLKNEDIYNIKHCIYTLSLLTNQTNKQNHKCLMSKTHFHIVLVFGNEKAAETEFAIEIAGF